jgi:acetyltransferase-like isoleucine patch superfamily enzyme
MESLTEYILRQIKHYLIFVMNFLYNYIVLITPLRRLYLNMLQIKLGKKSSIHSKVLIYMPGRLKIGNNTVINRDCTLDNRYSITIGSNVSIGHSTRIYSRA